MKNLKYALLAVTLLVSGGLMAETKAQAAKRKATAAKVKEYERKHKAKKAKTEKVGYSKKPAKPTTKKVTHTKTVRTSPARTTAVTTTTVKAKPQDKSYVTQLTDALGWTGGTTAAAAATSAIATKGHVKFEGPETFALDGHRIPYHWKQGWTGGYYNGEWQFAGHNLKWWHDNYLSYYRNVVRPEATKAGITERQHFAHEVATKRK